MSNLYTSYQHQSQNFRSEEPGTYSLCLFLQKDLAIYSLLSSENRIMAVKEYRSKVPMETVDFLDAVLSNDQFLKQEFAKVKIIVGAETFSLVPKPFFGGGSSRKWVQSMIREDLLLDHVDFHSIGRDEAMAVYTVPLAIKQKLDFFFKKPEYLPFCGSAVEMSYALADAQPNLILLNILGNNVVMTAIRDNQLQLCNSYECREATDIVYFVQLVAEVTKLKNTSFGLFVTGEFEMESELLRQLRKFIPILKIPSLELQENFDVKSDKLPSWKYAFMTY